MLFLRPTAIVSTNFNKADEIPTATKAVATIGYGLTVIGTCYNLFTNPWIAASILAAGGLTTHSVTGVTTKAFSKIEKCTFRELSASQKEKHNLAACKRITNYFGNKKTPEYIAAEKYLKRIDPNFTNNQLADFLNNEFAPLSSTNRKPTAEATDLITRMNCEESQAQTIIYGNILLQIIESGKEFPHLQHKELIDGFRNLCDRVLDKKFETAINSMCDKLEDSARIVEEKQIPTIGKEISTTLELHRPTAKPAIQGALSNILQ